MELLDLVERNGGGKIEKFKEVESGLQFKKSTLKQFKRLKRIYCG